MKTTTLRNTKQVALAAIAALSLAAVTVHADDATHGLPTRTVRYADLDVGTQAGAAALRHRIHQAAEAVCGDASSRQLADVMAVKACVARAVTTSEQSLNNARLAANR